MNWNNLVDRLLLNIRINGSISRSDWIKYYDEIYWDVMQMSVVNKTFKNTMNGFVYDEVQEKADVIKEKLKGLEQHVEKNVCDPEVKKMITGIFGYAYRTSRGSRSNK